MNRQINQLDYQALINQRIEFETDERSMHSIAALGALLKPSLPLRSASSVHN
jgi:hypothetical protein